MPEGRPLEYQDGDSSRSAPASLLGACYRPRHRRREAHAALQQLLSTAFGDPDGSSTNSLRAQFLGDYATAVASNSTGWFVWSDTRNETACAAVDAFRAGTASKPNPDTACPPSASGQLFGDSDIFVGAVSF